MSESYSVNIGVTASGVEQAISQLKQLEDSLNRINGMSAHVNVSMGNEDAINRIKDIEDAVNKINGTTATANVEMNGNSIDQINDVNDALNQINGSTSIVNVEVDSSAQNQFADIQDQIAQLNGETVHIGVETDSDMYGSNLLYNDSGGGNNFGGSKNNDGFDMSHYSNVFLNGAGRMAGKAAALIGGVGIGRSYSDYAKWEYQQAELEGVLDKSERTPEILEKLKSDSFQYANRGYSAYEMSQSQTELAKAGFTSEEIGNSLNGMINIANAGGLDIETSTGITSAVLRSFQLDTTKTDHVADVLAKTANATSSEIDGLGYSLKYCGSLSNTLGISLESTNASLGILSNYGIKGLNESCGPVVEKLAA